MKSSKKRIVSMILAFLLIMTSFLAQIGPVAKVKAEDKDVYLRMKAGNEWFVGNTKYTQVNGEIINNTNQRITGWKVKMPVQSGASIDQSWCGTYTISGEVLTIVPDGSNSTLWQNSNTTFGFIIKNADTLALSDAKLFYEGSEEPTVTPTPIPVTVTPIVTPAQEVTEEFLEGIWVDEYGFVCAYESGEFYTYDTIVRDPFNGSIKKVDEDTIKIKNSVAYRIDSELGKKYAGYLKEYMFRDLWQYESNHRMLMHKFTTNKVLLMQINDASYGITYTRQPGDDETEKSQEIKINGIELTTYGKEKTYVDYVRVHGSTMYLIDKSNGQESRLTRTQLIEVTPIPTKKVTPTATCTPTPTTKPITPTPKPITPTTKPITPTPVVTKVPTSTPFVTKTPTPTPKATIPPQQTDKDWLYTDGSRIYDANGKQVWLTGVNWFGYNTGTNIFDGVWSCDLDKTIKDIADRGFNLLRIPISSELLLDWKSGKYPKPCYNDYVNPYLAGMNSLEIFDHVVAECRKNGIKIMMDIHCATNAVAHYYPVWFTPDLTEDEYITSLKWLTNRYKDDDTIIAMDLKNEPHGKANDAIRAIWNDSKDQCNWKYAATKAANAVLSENPNLLIVVEGIEIYPMDLKNNSDYHSKNEKEYYGTWWGGNLRGVKDYPIDLGKYQNKLVYSPHDYGPAVFQQTWFTGNYTMQSLYDDCWYDNWFYIQEDNIAPLLIGEWGGFMTEPNLTWMTYLRDFIIKNKINHTFWCFNANSGDTGGLVLHDFTTWDEEKYEFLKPALWQKNGKFVGLDHDIPLGENGITLSQY